MPEQKKRGFHALEERIHQMEGEHAESERKASTERRPDAREDRSAAERGSPPEKKR